MCDSLAVAVHNPSQKTWCRRG